MKFRDYQVSIGPIQVGQIRNVEHPCEHLPRQYFGKVKITRPFGGNWECEILKKSDHRFGCKHIYFRTEHIK